MSEETKTRKPRSTNPFSQYKKAKAAADRARRAAARAEDLRQKAQEAADKAAELVARKEELEEAEQAAYDALQQALADLGDEAEGEDDDEGDEE